MSTLNTLYQFWIHTRAVKRVRGLEWILNTPSHHRVHHGVNPKYIDRNYAGVLILWDRLFGTFQEEEEEPVYGTVKPLASWNPLWANVHYWLEMGQMARATSRAVDRFKVWFMPPEWRPADLSEGLGYVTIPEASRATQRKYAVPIAPALVAYVAVSFLVVAVATTALLWFAHGASLAPMLASSLLILTTLMVWGGLVEGRSWAVPLEIARLAGVVAFVAWAMRESPRVASITALTALAAAGLAVWVVRARAATGAPPASPPPALAVPGE
jgi:alkylglycerol monooxygenase